MSKRGSLFYQMVTRLNNMAAYGQSKKAGKINGKPAPDKIYSYRTMESYKDTARHFCDWLKTAHPDVKTMKTAAKYAPEYIQHLTTETVPAGRKNAGGGYSAWTINTRAAGLRKALGLSPDQLPAPSRNRENVTQNRDLSWARAHFSPADNADLVTVCRGTGLRRSELAALRPDQVQDLGGGAAAIEGIRGKGGRVRSVQVLPGYADRILQLAHTAQAEGRDRLLGHIPQAAPIHAYRAQYARDLYTQWARPTASLGRDQLYTAYKLPVPRSWDRWAMDKVTWMLGHSRLDVAVRYLSSDLDMSPDDLAWLQDDCE